MRSQQLLSRKILFVLSSSRGIGGVETWLARTACHLRDEGWNVRVAILRGEHSDRFNRHHPRLVTSEIDGRGLDSEGRIRAIARTIDRDNPDIVVPLSSVESIVAACRVKTRSPKLRLACHAQGNLEPLLADIKCYADWIDCVICPGKLTSRWVTENANVPRAIVHHIPNGADSPSHPKSPRGDTFRVAFVGRFTEQDKRAHDIPPIIREANARGLPITWTIVGGGPLEDSIRSALRAQSNVRFLGELPPEEIYKEVYPQSDALLLTSDSEAFGIVIVEAMRHGVVPVVSRYLGWGSERLVVDDQNGLSFPVGDHSRAAGVFQRIAEDEEMYDRLSRASFELGNQYTWERCLDGWEQYLQLACRTAQRTGSGIPGAPALSAKASGRLARLPLPYSMVDLIRRFRRWLSPESLASLNVHWPLTGANHTKSHLRAIRQELVRLDKLSGANE